MAHSPIREFVGVHGCGTNMLKMLSSDLLTQWDKNGFIVLPSFFSADEINQVAQWVEEIAARPVKEGEHLNYYEMVGSKARISRTENFLPYHKGLRQFISESKLNAILEQLLGELAILFKEKINYKYTGTGKYNPHQDIHAFDTSPLAFQEYHYNCAIFVDDATIENGCFEIVPGYKNELLGRNRDGSIIDEIANELPWQAVEVKAGSVMIFNCWVPHKSERNMSASPRRSIYLTFNGVSKGDLREAHYQDRASGKGKTREINSELFIQKNIPEGVIIT